MQIPLTLFKLALFLALAAVGYLFVFRLRSRLLNRVLVSGVLGLIAVFLVAPDLSTRIARSVGIGRGADLLFYLAHLGVAFLVALLYVRIQELSARVTQLARSVALLTAQSPEDRKNEP
jgi:small membrane protein